MTRFGDLLEDFEGDKAVVTAVNANGKVRVRWDCTGNESDWIDPSRFTNLTERVAEESPLSPEVTGDTIHDRMQRVREHPDYVFGTYFTVHDFDDDRVPDDFPVNRATDALAEAGNQFIYFVTEEGA